MMYKWLFMPVVGVFVRFKLKILKQDVFAYNNPAEKKTLLLLEVGMCLTSGFLLDSVVQAFPVVRWGQETSQHSAERERESIRDV